ncbi:hypothetical protein [Sporosarcina obsidiansis]|uniref:hypothetical protein n=1 Tax=Sporosarcina obsidiansis TaxID=2660748 RepID=UPI00129B40B7|nr:hypothetical protein [Sporosarcina obsidiansis]
MAELYHNRPDIRFHIEQFPNNQVYFFMKEKYHELTNQGDADLGEEGRKYHEQVEVLAGEKFSLRPEETAAIFDELDTEARNFMLNNK